MVCIAGGELFERVAGSGPLPEARARPYMHQLLDGLAHCHARGVFHRCCRQSLCDISLVYFCYSSKDILTSQCFWTQLVFARRECPLSM